MDKKDVQESNINNLLKRISFYLPYFSLKNIELLTEFKKEVIINNQNPVLIYNSGSDIPDYININRVFNIDYRSNPTDGWAWCRLVNFCLNDRPAFELSKSRFVNYVNTLLKLSYKKTYVFGTGSSLEKALDKDWSDGYRIVCNTIVRDPELWNHINPHFIVAGDAIFHFGFTPFASAFRRDLYDRFKETNTYFLYPELFHNIVIRDFEEFSNRLIPIPKGQYQKINVDLTQTFQLPSLHNVLGLLLLPLACTLSKNIYLWGFDGKAPGDKYFWSNSQKHSYPELFSDLQKAHPYFFEHFVPETDKTKYTNIAFGDLFEKILLKAEKEGYKFNMMHKSWTPKSSKNDLLK
ncbi:MAG: hypothetical protein OMM_05880 [Candidatus Magnetoglobus multicellularis str. Araruama]|uniref:Uncharacterized protein n=1 Tax=Candidatus Magnetoglobus multicellularis str. Araruama TaxID=890399 RepID=A0A1V1NTI9_9BACT|nr:MAG: hypothetical protein OMM_05880 [Candidatus Magnetoglobus multicellularis str. Araruama]